MNPPPSPLVIDRRVEFSQTDAAGIMHFSTYFTFMEAAEAELFRRLGLKLLSEEEGRPLGFPRVECQCRFTRPLSFDDRVQIHLVIEDMVGGRIHYGFSFFNESGKRCASGSMVTTCAARESSGRLVGASLPEKVRLALESWKNQPS